MASIRAMIEKQQQKRGRSADVSTVEDVVNYYLKTICKFLPDDSNEGHEFAQVMFAFSTATAEKQIEESIKELVKKAMDERNDLIDYPNLRQKIVDEINKRG